MAETIHSAVIEVGVDSSGAVSGLNQINESVQRTGRTLENLSGQSTGLANVGTTSTRSAREVEASTRNIQTQIQRTIAQLEAGSRSGSRFFEVLANQRGANLDTLRPLLDQLDQVTIRQRGAEQALNSTAPALNRVGVSAAQTAAALRGVPAQMTDIITSIQGGQAPLTVFLQQGGQLKDMFGGIGPAARALGGYIAGLVNPFTLAAGAAVLLGVAYSQGAEEARAYNKALILTGNAAGTSAGQMADMARAISAAVGTQGAAAEALNALAGTGRVSAANLQAFGEVAIKVQRTLGQGVADTAAEFADLGKTPVASLEKLNDKYHFLTASVYEQVRALERQGLANEAGQTAQKAYADALEGMSSKLKSNLGTVEKAWISIKDVAKGAWDAMLNVGREDSLGQQLAKVQKEILAAQTMSDKAIGSYVIKAKLDQNIALEASLKNQIKLADEKAKKEAESDALNRAGVTWMKEGEKYLTRAQQLELDITTARNQGNAAHVSSIEIEKRIGEIQKKYADIYNDSIDSQIESLKRRASLEEISAKRGTDQVAADRSAGLITERDAIEKLAASELAQFSAKKSYLQEELALTAHKQNSLKDQESLRGQIAENEARATSRQMQLSSDLFVMQAKNEADVFDQILQSTAARQLMVATLEVENATYGKGTEARSLAMVAMKEELDLETKLAAARKKEGSNADATIAQLTAESKKRLEVTQSTMAQSAALGYAQQLADENEKFAAESINDEHARSLAILEIDANTWRQRIANTKEGSEERKKFEENFATWYKNQLSKPVMDSQREMWKSIDQVAHDTFVNILQNGTSAFDKLRDTLKSGLYDLLYQITVKQWLINISAQVSGSGGLTSNSGGLNSMASYFQAGQSLWSGFSGGFSQGLGSIATKFGETVGSTWLQGAGGGMTGAFQGAMADGTSLEASTSGASFGSSAGAVMPYAAIIAAAMAINDKLYGKGWNISNGTNLNTAGTALNGFAGGYAGLLTPVGQVSISDRIMQSLGLNSREASLLSGSSVISALFGNKNPEVTRQSLAGSFGPSGFSGSTATDWFSKGGWFSSDKSGTQTNAIDAATTTALSGGFDAMKASATEAAKILGVSAEALKTNTYSIAYEFSRTGDAAKDQAENQKRFQAALDGVGNTIAQQLVPNIKDFELVNESAGAALLRVSADYSNVDTVLNSIGDSFKTVGVGSIAARERLIELSGGFEKFAGDAAFFQQNFLSEAERNAPVLKSVAEQMAALGLSSVTTREAFKQTVLGLDLTDEAQAKTYASLMNVEQAFAQVHPAIDSVSDALAKAAAAAQERKGLQDQLDQLTMTSVQLREKERAAVDESNRSLFDQITAQQAAKDAAEAVRVAAQAAAAHDADVANERKSLQEQLDQLTMTSVQLREKERAALDETNRSLFDQITAQQAAKAAADAAEQHAAAVAQERKSLQDQLDQLTMTSAQLREKERAALDETNRALYDQVTAQLAAKAAAEAAAQHERDVANERKSLQDQLDQLTMTSTQLTEKQRAALDESNRSLFDQITAQQAIRDAAEAARQHDQTVADERKTIQDQLDQLTLTSVQLREKERAALDESNKALFDQVTAQTAAKAASEALAATNAEYQRQIDEMVTASLPLSERRAIEVKGMDASTLALYERLEALKKEASATAEAKAALDAAAARANAILQERRGLQDQLDQLTLTSTELIQKQRAALNASNRALFDQIQLINAQHEQQARVDTARSNLTDAYKREADAIDALKAHAISLVDSLAAYGTTLANKNSTPAERLTQAKTNFEGVSALAAAGNLDALDKLQAAAERYLAAADEVQQAATGLTTNARATLTESYKREAQALQDLKSRVDGLGTSLGDYMESLRTEALTPAQRLAEARTKFQDVAASAAQGNLAALEQLQGAAERYLAASREVQSSSDSLATSAKSQLLEAYQRESGALQATIDKHKAYADSLKATRDAQLLGSLSSLSPEQKYLESRRQLATATPETLQASIQTFLEQSRGFNATSTGFLADEAYARSLLDAAITGADQQQTDAQRQLAALNQQVSGLVTVNTSVLGVQAAIDALSAAQQQAGTATSAASNATLAQVMEALGVAGAAAQAQSAIANAQLSSLNTQVSGLVDINASVISVHDAILAAQGQDGAGPATGVLAQVQAAIQAAQAAAAGQVAASQAQLGALNNQVSGLITINASVLSVRDAIEALQNAKAGLGAAATAVSPPGLHRNDDTGVYSFTSTSGEVWMGGNDLKRQALDGFNFAFQDPSILQSLYDKAKRLGVGGEDFDYLANLYGTNFHSLIASTLGLPAFAAGGDHMGGARMVGEVGPEIELTGAARYWSASKTRNVLNGKDANDDQGVISKQMLAVLQAIAAKPGLTDANIVRAIGKLEQRLIQVEGQLALARG